MAPGGGKESVEEGARWDVTFSLPPSLAAAIRYAARCAGRLDNRGRVRMDHMVLVPADLAETGPGGPPEGYLKGLLSGL